MRDDKITIAKAIGIILMVVVHAGLPQMEANFIIMFHMPLFFIVSGYCFKEKYLSNNTDFIKRKIKSLYIPYIKYSLLFLLLHNIFFHLNIYNDIYGFKGEASHLYSIKEYLSKAFHIITAMREHEQLLGGYWFLKQLFLGSIFSFFVIKTYKNHIFLALICIISACAFTSYFNIQVPYFNIDSLTILSMFFFISGYYLRTSVTYKGHSYLNILCFITVLSISLLLPTSMLRFNYTNILPYTIAAIAGTHLTLYLSNIINQSRYRILKNSLLYIGNNTLPILTWHFLSFKLLSILIIYIQNRPIQHLAYFPIIENLNNQWIWVLAYSLSGICVPLIISEIIYKITQYYKNHHNKTNI